MDEDDAAEEELRLLEVMHHVSTAVQQVRERQGLYGDGIRCLSVCTELARRMDFGCAVAESGAGHAQSTDGRAE